jgi:hypothetical protein
MKKTTLFRLALIGSLVAALQNAPAGSAVALAPHNQVFTSFGHPKEIAKQIALGEARRKYGNNVRILAASDVSGYCAIAVARVANGNWLIGVSLGKRSATEAETLALSYCRKAGGINPQIKSAFKG